MFISTVALLGYIHRDDLFRAHKPAQIDALSPFRTCVSDRWAIIDQMAADGIADDAEIALFKSRAEALCRAQNPQ